MNATSATGLLRNATPAQWRERVDELRMFCSRARALQEPGSEVVAAEARLSDALDVGVAMMEDVEREAGLLRSDVASHRLAFHNALAELRNAGVKFRGTLSSGVEDLVRQRNEARSASRCNALLGLTSTQLWWLVGLTFVLGAVAGTYAREWFA